MTNNEKVEIHFGLQPLASAENKNKKKYTRNKNKRSTNQTQTNQIKLYTYIQGKVQSLLNNRQPRAGSTRLSLEKKASEATQRAVLSSVSRSVSMESVLSTTRI